MDPSALFTISYGLYILCAEHDGRKNGCVINTLSQVTEEPLTVSIIVMKKNLTHDFVKASGRFSISVLGKHVPMELIKRFGFQSGRDVDKFKDFECSKFDTGDVLIRCGCIAALSCKVINAVDFPTHTVFYARVEDATKLENDKPMTYELYRDLKTGKVKPDEEESDKVPLPAGEPEKKEYWQCSVCHYVYDGDIPFEDLPDDYICPLCGQPKAVFEKHKG